MTARIISIDRSFPISSTELTLPLTITSKGSEQARNHVHENYPTDGYRTFYRSIIDKQQPRHMSDRRLDPVVARIIDLASFTPLTDRLSDVLDSPSNLWVHELTESKELVEDFAVLLACRLIIEFNVQAKIEPRITYVPVFSAFIDQLRAHVSRPTSDQRLRFQYALTSPSPVDVWLRSVLLVGQDQQRMLISFTSVRDIDTIKKICSGRAQADYHSRQLTSSTSSSNNPRAGPSTNRSIALSTAPRVAVQSVSQSSKDVISLPRLADLSLQRATEQADQSINHSNVQSMTSPAQSQVAPCAKISTHVSLQDEFDDMPSLEADDIEQISESHVEQLADEQLVECAARLDTAHDVTDNTDPQSNSDFVAATPEQSLDTDDNYPVDDQVDDDTSEVLIVVDEDNQDHGMKDDEDDVVITHAILASPSRPSFGSPVRLAQDLIRVSDGDDEYYIQYENEKHEVDESDSDVSHYDDHTTDQDEKDAHAHRDQQLDMANDDDNDASMSVSHSDSLSMAASDAEQDDQSDSHFSSFAAFDEGHEANADVEDDDSVDQGVDEQSDVDQHEPDQSSNQTSSRSRRRRKSLKVWQYKRAGGPRLAQDRLGKWIRFVMKNLHSRAQRGNPVTSYRKLLPLALVRSDGAEMLRQALLQLQHEKKIVFLLPEDIEPGRYITDSVLRRMRMSLA